MLDVLQNALGTRQPRPLDLSVDKTLTLLRNSRRRTVIERVSNATGSVDLSDLAERIAAREEGVPRDALTAQARKRVYVGLYQTHLPKMDAAGLVEYDKPGGDVTATWRTQPALEIAETVAAAHGGDR